MQGSRRVGAPLGPGGAHPPQAPPAADVSLAEGCSLKAVRQSAAEEVERRVIRQVLRQTKGNKSQAAKLLKIDYKTVYSKMKQYGIRSREFLP